MHHDANAEDAPATHPRPLLLCRPRSSSTALLTWVLLAFFLISDAAQASIAVVVVVNCTSTDDVVVQSSTTYVLNCPQPGYRRFVEAGGISDNLSHVVVHATGGNTLPRWVMESGGLVENVSLRLTNLCIPGPDVLPSRATLPLLTSALLNVGGRQVDGLHILLENVTLHVATSNYSVALFTIGTSYFIHSHAGSPIRNLTFSIANSTITHNGTTSSFLMVRHQYGNLSGLLVRVVDSNITISGTASGFLLDFYHYSLEKHGIENALIVFRDSMIQQTWSSLLGIDQNSTLGGLLSMQQYRQSDVHITISGVHWTATAATLQYPHRVSSVLAMVNIQPVGVVNGVVVLFDRIWATMHAAASATLLQLSYSRTNVSDLSLVLESIRVSIKLSGAMSGLAPVRSATVLAFTSTSFMLSDATSHPISSSAIRLTDIVVHAHVVSGEAGAFAASDSDLITAFAAMVSIASSSQNVSLAVAQCHLRGAVTGGTTPTVNGLMVFFTSVVSLVVFVPGGGSIQDELGVTVQDSTVRADTGFDITPTFLLIALATSCSAIVSAMTNCTDCRFAIYDSRVEVVSMAFQNLPQRKDVFSDINFLNLTSIFLAINPFALLSAAIVSHPLQGLLPSILFGDPIRHVRVRILLRNATALYGPGITEPPTKLDVLALAILAMHVADSTVALSANNVKTPASTSASPSRPSAVGAVGGTTILRTSITVSDLHGIGLSALILINAGLLTINDSQLAFAQCTVDGHTPVVDGQSPQLAIAAHGTSDGTFNILATNTSFAIANARFTSFALLADPRFVSLSSLTLGCNLWNGAPLPPAAIGVPLEHVVYPRGVYADDSGGDASGAMVCKGLQTKTHSLSIEVTPSTVVGSHLTRSPAASTVTSVATFASAMGPVVPRSAVGAVQGALGLLRLAAACRHGYNDGGVVGRADDDEREEEGSAMLDNPLQLYR